MLFEMGERTIARRLSPFGLASALWKSRIFLDYSPRPPFKRKPAGNCSVNCVAL